MRLLHTSFFFNDTATTEIYTLALHGALPIWAQPSEACNSEHDRKQRQLEQQQPPVCRDDQVIKPARSDQKPAVDQAGTQQQRDQPRSEAGETSERGFEGFDLVGRWTTVER